MPQHRAAIAQTQANTLGRGQAWLATSSHLAPGSVQSPWQAKPGLELPAQLHPCCAPPILSSQPRKGRPGPAEQTALQGSVSARQLPQRRCPPGSWAAFPVGSGLSVACQQHGKGAVPQAITFIQRERKWGLFITLPQTEGQRLN